MSTAAIPFPQPRGYGQISRVTDLFRSPSRLFADVRRSTSWWLPFVLTVICSLTMTLSAVSRVGFRQMAVNTMKADPGTAILLEPSTPADQRQQAIDTTETTLKVSAAATPLLILLYNALYALVLWGGLNVLGGRADFASVFTVLLYADLIQDVRAILGTAVLRLVPDANTFNMQNPFGSNIGYYLPTNFLPWARTLLETMDLLTIWYLALIALGCSIVGRINRGAARSLVFGIWLAIVAVRVTWALIA